MRIILLCYAARIYSIHNLECYKIISYRFN